MDDKVTIKVRTSREEHQLWRALAAADRRALSAWIRVACAEKAERDSEKEEACNA